MRHHSLSVTTLITWGFATVLLIMPAVSFSASSEHLVRGFIAASVGGKSELGEKSPPRENFYLPGVHVFFHNLQTNTDTHSVKTDLSGRFTIRVKDSSKYSLCWESEAIPKTCGQHSIGISKPYQNIGTIIIPLPQENGSVAVYGRVSHADGSSPRFFEPLANINALAKVTLQDKGGTKVYEVAVNNHDQYVLPLVPLGKFMQLRIQQERYEHVQPVQLGNAGVPTQKIDLVILNTPPVLDPLVALDANQRRVSNPKASDTLNLNVRVTDREKDKLGFLWQVTGGTLSSPTDAEPKWTLPKSAGNHVATLIAYDSKGGYAKSSVKVTTDRNGMEFSGFVSGTDTPVLKGAVVEIGGRTAVTDSSGFFKLRLNDRKRFVMSIRKKGYALASNVYYDSVIGGRWQLTRANVFRVDPTKPLDLQSKRSPRECPGPASVRLDWKSYPTLAVPQYQDGHGNIVPLPKEASQLPGLPKVQEQPKTGECGPGVRIQFKANSFVDVNGNPPPGLVDVQISTVDLQSGNQMPGNYTVLESNNSVGVMQSYGAGVIEISSGATKYNIRSGMAATVMIPVDPTQLASGGALPGTIPLLSYDETRAVWKRDGKLILKTVSGKKAYVSKISHLTAYNSDLIKTDQACLAVQNQGMPATYDLEWTIPQSGGAAPVVRRVTVDGGNAETALLNLPKQTNITLVPIRTGDPDPNKNNLPIGVFVVNTGAPQNPAWPTVPGGFANEPQGPPYYHETGGVPDGACSTKVVLTDLGLNFYPSTPRSGAFLHGLGIGAYAAVNLTDTDPNFPLDANQILRDAVAAASVDYRRTIDPRGLRPTLSCFKVANRMPLRPGETCPQHTGTGFVPQPAIVETTAAYANTVDLGFGREMHCVQDGANAACYVSNYDQSPYTGPGQGPDITKAQHAVEGLNGTRVPDATVAMEFSQIEDAATNGSPVTLTDPERVVKFYVFNQAGNPVDAADLDGLGARPVPQLCMVCHGGQIPNATGTTSTAGGVSTPVFNDGDPTTDDRPHVKLGSRFLPFDLQSFTYAAPDSDAGNPFNKLNQQAAFKRLNEIAEIAPPPDPADPSSSVVSDLFDVWYPGGALPQIESAVPALWNTDALHRNAYINVVGKACRTCHVSNLAPNLRFERPGASGFDGQLGVIQLRTCNDHVMPHARRTHDLFWTSVNPSQPAQLQAFGDSINAFGWQDVNDPGVSDSLACGQEFTPGGGALSPPTAFTAAKAVLSTCAGCHSAANAAPGSAFNVAGLNLEATVSYSQLVGVNSTELPSFQRVEFGTNTELTSYLWRKISDTHTGLGAYVAPGPGGAMPLGSSGLTNGTPQNQADANTIRDWIRNGAQP
ncbi:MAG: hypothetical protein IPP12_07020 [Nitrospira sp.]|nr:hypothetical protein [Nitrospira sp.]